MEKQVKIYTLSTCIYCQNTKAFFKQNGVPYECVDVDLLDEAEKTATLREIRKLVPSIAFPTILIGDEIVQGYKPDVLRKLLNL